MFLSWHAVKFQEHMKALNYSPRTIRDYGFQLSYFMRYLESSNITEVGQITRDVVRNYQMGLLTQEKQISLDTQRSRVVSLKSLFRYLFKTNQVMYDPTSDLEMPRRKKNLPRAIMTKKEIFTLLNQPDCDKPLGLRDKAILELLYSTGIRNQEIRQLTVYDVNTVEHDLNIRQGKGQKDRVVPLGEIASNYIDEYLKHGRPKLLNGQETQLLFITKNGLPINHANLIWLVRKYVKRAKIDKNVTPHSVRHTFATHMLKNKAPLPHIQQLLGHESIETTLIYTQVEVSDLKKAHKMYHPRERG